MNDNSYLQIFSALPIRALFQAYHFKPSHTLSLVASEIVTGSQTQTQMARSQSYLTNSTQMGEQIRFPLRDRVERMLSTLAEDFRNQFGIPRLRRLVIPREDFLSHYFFKKLGFKLDSQNGTALVIQQDLLNPEEKNVLQELKKTQPDLSALVHFAKTRIYSCDYQTALNVLSLLPTNHQRADIHHLKGLCHNFFSETVAAEKEFNLMMTHGHAEAKANAGYVLSMLYLRLHPAPRQDLTKAENYIQTAYHILLQEPFSEAVQFLRIFNRNGYALCLYRRGRVQEAAEMLEWGISELKKIGQKSYDLHLSVLLYNALQCYRTMGLYQQCEQITRELLSLDPLFPEYHLEHAKTLLEQSKISEARSFIQKAIALDPQIPEAYALLGYSHVLDEDYPLAAPNYRTALSLKPESEQFQNDLAYCQQQMEAAS